MAKCKDCLHYKACSAFSKIINVAVDVEKGCEHFQDPSRFAEVVRCKECKHCTPDENIVGGYGDCFYKDDIHSIVNADDFCSYGERKDNG